ncbi:hypothetical protein BaRGS_00029760, partial [Batillaria attramentaria]
VGTKYSVTAIERPNSRASYSIDWPCPTFTVPAKVLVTGASGYIASHVVKQLQEAGHQVRGTVRSVKNTDKVKHLYNLCPYAAHKLELVEADLMDAESWQPAVQGMTYVIHVASPFPMTQPKNEDELIIPARDGTLNVLRACAKVPTIKRIVLTSSCASVGWEPRGENEPPRTEADWTDVDKVDAYSKSKTLAERAAWEFVRGLSGEERFELAVINPSLVLGPPLHGSACSSVDVMKQLLEKQTPVLPRMNLAIVDVRDVAQAHVRAMTSPDAAGNRHICNAATMQFAQIGVLLKSVFGPQGYDVPTCVAPDFMIRFASCFDKQARTLLPHIGDFKLFDNTRMREVLGVQPREMRDSIIEMAYALIENGFVKKTKKYRGPGGPEERQRYMALQL